MSEPTRRPSREVPASAAILAIAQARAAALLQGARDGAEALRQEAFESGYQAGVEEGRRAAEEQVLQRYQQALEQVQAAGLVQEQTVRGWFLESEPEIVSIVLEVAATVMKKQVEVDREVAVAQVRNALAALGHTAWTRVRVNPIDLGRVEVEYPSRQAVTGEVFTVLGDESITPGGCIAHGPGATVDATLEAQLEGLREVLQQRAS